ncbi:hypothetical protein QYM41_08610 [Kocuria sp. CPCC 205268]
MAVRGAGLATGHAPGTAISRRRRVLASPPVAAGSERGYRLDR